MSDVQGSEDDVSEQIICGACDKESWKCGCPIDVARDAKAAAERAIASEASRRRTSSVTEGLASEYARGVAEERMRCIRLVRYEGHNHGAGDDGPDDRAQSMSDAIVEAIKEGRPASDWPV